MLTARPRQRFPRSTRLKNPLRIRHVCRNGRRCAGSSFTVHWEHHSGPLTKTETLRRPGTRLAFVVSRQLGKAHRRNRIKRRLREAARLSRSSWPSETDVVFRATKEQLAGMKFDELVANVRDSLQEIARRSCPR